MKISLLSALALLLGVGLVVFGASAFAQDAVDDQDLPSTYVESDDEYVLDYSDYTVKGFSLSFGGGLFGGVTYLDLQPLGERTAYPINTGDDLGPGDILGFDNLPLEVSRARGSDGYFLFDAAQKEIKSGPAFSGRVGIYIAENFHLDVVGSFASGETELSMVYRGETNDSFTQGQRYYGVDLERNKLPELRNPAAFTDDSFSVLKGGLGLMYDATPARFFGITPRIGFGLGGIINSYSQLDDNTALYLEGTLGLDYKFGRALDIFAQADVTTFAFELDELGYSEMVSYKVFTFGLRWFTDVLPTGVREAHLAGQ
ncbi:MAG: hypothetical protein GY838_09645 [bacterium]|nr:hypothetical protein [bacterium]